MHDALLTETQLSNEARRSLFDKYSSKIETNPAISRSLVSYQANKNRPYYRWFKYKEGFSAALVEYILDRFGHADARILDPFAGSGAALFVARDNGMPATGIELLPVGEFAIRARLAAEAVSQGEFRREVQRFRRSNWRKASNPELEFQHFAITRNAFSAKTERDLTCFRTYVHERVASEHIRDLFLFACMSVLESISFTRKDGQYLRWDYRSNRNLKGRRFDKGKIPAFEDAIHRQFQIMLEDIGVRDLFYSTSQRAAFHIERGSCLTILPKTPSTEFDLVITSPPYCNRYDYTRTYALELAFLGVTGDALKELRQELLSCTVENRAKVNQLCEQYKKFGNRELLDDALDAFETQDALQEVLSILDAKRTQGLLNNSNVPRMVRNYFLESAVVIFELGRVVKPGGHVVMVNDNVQYAGEEIPVDLILSDIANKAGFDVRSIWTLGRGKGNSSQQMGAHGRNELRKCAYVWRRAT